MRASVKYRKFGRIASGIGMNSMRELANCSEFGSHGIPFDVSQRGRYRQPSPRAAATAPSSCTEYPHERQHQI
jgi:hypothetical protein